MFGHFWHQIGYNNEFSLGRSIVSIIDFNTIGCNSKNILHGRPLKHTEEHYRDGEICLRSARPAADDVFSPPAQPGLCSFVFLSFSGFVVIFSNAGVVLFFLAYFFI